MKRHKVTKSERRRDLEEPTTEIAWREHLFVLIMHIPPLQLFDNVLAGEGTVCSNLMKFEHVVGIGFFVHHPSATELIRIRSHELETFLVRQSCLKSMKLTVSPYCQHFQNYSYFEWHSAVRRSAVEAA